VTEPMQPAAPEAQASPPSSPAPMNPYAAGILLGLILLAASLILGAPLSVTQGLARLGAGLVQAVLPGQASAHFPQYLPNPLVNYLTFLLPGLILGGTFAALTRGRGQFKQSGPRQDPLRVLIGGLMCGLGAGLAGGGLIDLGLWGGSLLLTGSAVFGLCLALGGYVAAKFAPKAGR